MSGLRIVHCLRAPIGGVLRHVGDLVEAQHARGHQIGILCDSLSGGEAAEAALAGLAPLAELGVIRLPIARQIGPADLATAFSALPPIFRMRPDILHGHGAKGGMIAKLAGFMLRRTGRKVATLYAPHGGSLHHDPASRGSRLLFASERLSERTVDRLLFVCEFERETYRRKVREPRCPALVIPNGLREAEFTPVQLSDAPADFLFIGEIRELKGWDLFLDALCLARQTTGKNLTAWMVGDGPDREQCLARIRELHLTDRVCVAPPMPARQAFAMARAVVVPSRAEALPYIVLETLAAGRPLVTTRIGGIPEIFGEADASLCLPTVSSIAGGMCRFLRDPAGYGAEMPAVTNLRDRFHVGKMSAAIEAAYRQSLAG